MNRSENMFSIDHQLPLIS